MLNLKRQVIFLGEKQERKFVIVSVYAGAEVFPSSWP